MRPNADPKKCYSDKRVESIVGMISIMGDHIRTHNPENWLKLYEETLKIFQVTHEEMGAKLKAKKE